MYDSAAEAQCTLEENNKQTWELQEELQMCIFFNFGLLRLMTLISYCSDTHGNQQLFGW